MTDVATNDTVSPIMNEHAKVITMIWKTSSQVIAYSPSRHP
jgi:hypothetical protein